jgi:hypothetical protein
VLIPPNSILRCRLVQTQIKHCFISRTARLRTVTRQHQTNRSKEPILTHGIDVMFVPCGSVNERFSRAFLAPTVRPLSLVPDMPGDTRICWGVINESFAYS